MRDKNDLRVKFANDVFYSIVSNELFERKIENRMSETNYKEFVLSIKDDIKLMYDYFSELIRNFYEIEEFIPLLECYKFYTNFDNYFDIYYINEELELTLQQFEEKIISDMNDFMIR